MKTKSLTGVIMVIGLLSLPSCKKYLDVKPEDKFLESQLFSSKTGIESALNNVYLQLPSAAMYGANLSTTVVELLAQRYNVSNYIAYVGFTTYNFSDPYVAPAIDTIWSSSFNAILNINRFINNLNIYKGVVSQAESDIMQGEAYALRAMVHFDLLRLFGPVYLTNSQGAAIPYYTVATPETLPAISAKDVMTNVLTDLKKAEDLLASDPIIAKGKQEALQNDGNDFFRFRNLRMNYYAVKALQARVQLYAGNNVEALAAAKKVISDGAAVFPWSNPSDVTATTNPDRIFSSEIIFALQNLNLYTYYNSLFVTNTFILSPSDFRLQEVYEVQSQGVNDYRYRSQWGSGLVYGSNRRFLKYADVTDLTKPFRYMQPLLRMSELYYIAAETETDPQAALGYLNTVRFNRGLSDLPAGTDINAELAKEYQKEFFGEGQLFFYYKRTDTQTILDGAAQDDFTQIYMKDNYYVAPRPAY